MVETDKDPGKTSIQVIERTIMLFDTLTDYADPVSLKALSASTGLHPSIVYRILNDMMTCRFVDRSDPGDYRLGMRLLELGDLIKARLSVRETALVPMHALHRLTNQTVNLSVCQDGEIIYIKCAYFERFGMQVVHAIGGHALPHPTSIDELFLAVDELGRAHAYATHTGLSGHTRTSIMDLSKLERELNWVRTDGYAHDNEKLELGVHRIVAGIYDDPRCLVAGLSLSVSADRLQNSWPDNLKDITLQISRGMSYTHEDDTVRAE